VVKMINTDSLSNRIQVCHDPDLTFNFFDIVGWTGDYYEMYCVNRSYDGSGIVILADDCCYVIQLEGIIPSDLPDGMYYHDEKRNGKVTLVKNDFPAFKVIQGTAVIGSDIRFE